MSIGKIVQVMGPVVDVSFETGKLPEIYTEVEIKPTKGENLICEVQQHLGESTVRSVSMVTTASPLIAKAFETKDCLSELFSLLAGEKASTD